MSLDCFISIVLDVEFTQENIYKLLLKGDWNRFQYYNYTWGQNINEIHVINPDDVLKQVMKLYNTKSIDGAYVFIKLEDGTDLTWWFYNENNHLKLCIGAFGADSKKKDELIDLGHYLSLFLNICKDFVIIKVEAKFFDE